MSYTWGKFSEGGASLKSENEEVLFQYIPGESEESYIIDLSRPNHRNLRLDIDREDGEDLSQAIRNADVEFYRTDERGDIISSDTSILGDKPSDATPFVKYAGNIRDSPFPPDIKSKWKKVMSGLEALVKSA